MDLDIVDKIKCRRVIVEFLRVNTFIKRTFKIDYTKFTHKEGGYYHLPLDEKKQLISKIKTKEISVCEDCDSAYEYWKNNLNTFPDDCCNLIFNQKHQIMGNRSLLIGKKTAFLCSSTSNVKVVQEAEKWAQAQKEETIVISGFQSRAEIAVLDILLAKNTKIIMVLAKKMFEKCPLKYKKAVEDGRMLIIAPFEDCDNLVTKVNAQKRNEYLLNRAKNIVIGYISPDGMLDALLEKQKKSYEVLIRSI